MLVEIGAYPSIRPFPLPSELYQNWDDHGKEWLEYLNTFFGENLAEKMKNYITGIKPKLETYSKECKAYEKSCWLLCIDSFLQLELF